MNVLSFKSIAVLEKHDNDVIVKVFLKFFLLAISNWDFAQCVLFQDICATFLFGILK